MTLNVVEACSGLRMLVTFFAFSVAAVFLMDRHWIVKGLVLASAVPIALLTNVLRITGTGLAHVWLHDSESKGKVLEFIHDFNGWMMMPVGLTFLLLELWLFKHLLIERAAVVSPSADRASPTAAADCGEQSEAAVRERDPDAGGPISRKRLAQGETMTPTALQPRIPDALPVEVDPPRVLHLPPRLPERRRETVAPASSRSSTCATAGPPSSSSAGLLARRLRVHRVLADPGQVHDLLDHPRRAAGPADLLQRGPARPRRLRQLPQDPGRACCARTSS